MMIVICSLRALGRRSCSNLISATRFHVEAERTLGIIEEHVDEKLDVPGQDVVGADGVLTLSLGRHGTWVLNKQAPNRQLWYSSPKSGPKRYDFSPESSRWVNSKDKHLLQQLLTDELNDVAGESVPFVETF